MLLLIVPMRKKKLIAAYLKCFSKKKENGVFLFGFLDYLIFLF